MKKQNKSVVRSGKPPAKMLDGMVTSFTSRGAASSTSTVGNQVIIMNIEGNPFDGTQGGYYRTNSFSIDPRAYFSLALFNAYDYYQMDSCETSFTWAYAPENGGPVMGELMWVFDKDSRTIESVRTIANRSTLQTRTFTNTCLRHIVKWQPYLVEDSDTIGVVGKQVKYVQPRGRWLNTDEVDSHRFGTIKTIAQAFDKSQYPSNDPIIQVRHRVALRFKGLKNVQPTLTQLSQIKNLEAISNQSDSEMQD